MKLDYSVIIRTTGKAHEKYQALLESISKLEPQPQEVIVVLPEGYSLPEEQLGWETFYFSRKGMVIQRMTGIAKCKTRYALICDDDVSFGPDFIKKLYEPIRQGLCSFSAGPLFSFLPRPGIHTIICTLTGGTPQTLFHKNRYITVLRSSGYSFNRHLDCGQTTYYESQSLAWTCFFADINAFNILDFGAESWLDSHGYSALDDQTMFYKAWLRGLKTIVVSTALYKHLDGKTSTRNNKPAVLYAGMFNRVVFWHRFIYSQQRNFILKTYSRVCFGYYIMSSFIINLMRVLRRKLTKEDFQILRKGYADGWSFIRSDEYRKLPVV